MDNGQSVPNLTIDEIARRVGMTPRNIRAHQSRGLLAPPQRRGRVAYYGEEHVTRLRQIQQLQSQGFNLAAIQALLSAGEGGSSAGLQRLGVSAMAPGDTLVVDAPTLAAMFDKPADPARRAVAMRHGMVRDRGDGTYEVSRRLAEAAAALVRLGGPTADEVLDLQVDLMRATAEVAGRFVDLCVQRAWQPFARDSFPAQRWPEVRTTLERMGELAESVLVETFAVQVRAAAEQRLTEGPRRVAAGAGR